MNLGRGMFLHGAPGNGKSSVAERISRVFHRHIWIPRALTVGGEILRLYDSIHHVEADDDVDPGNRPAIVRPSLGSDQTTDDRHGRRIGPRWL